MCHWTMSLLAVIDDLFLWAGVACQKCDTDLKNVEHGHCYGRVMLNMIIAMAELDNLIFAQKEVCKMLISVTGG